MLLICSFLSAIAEVDFPFFSFSLGWREMIRIKQSSSRTGKKPWCYNLKAKSGRLEYFFSDEWLNSSINVFLRGVEYSVLQFGHPPAGSEPLKFDTIYSQNLFNQFLRCLWKQNLVYWRSPAYNAMRLYFTTISALIFGTIFWDIGSKR